MLRAQLGAAEPHPEVTVGGVRLAYDDEGYGPAIVCLHAVGHGASDFAALRARFRDRHRVIALDWPGHGRSGDDTEPPSIARYSELLRLFLLAARVDKCVLVGNSIGGGAAIAYAVDQPDRVRGLVLENPAGLDPHDLLSGLAIAAMVRFFEAGERGAVWFPFAFSHYYHLVLPSDAASQQRERIIAAGAEAAALLRQAWASFAEPESDLRGLAPRVEQPVLFAWADRDRFVQLARSQPAINAFPHATLRNFDAGHSPHLEQPEAFFAAVEEFLAQLP